METPWRASLLLSTVALGLAVVGGPGAFAQNGITAAAIGTTQFDDFEFDFDFFFACERDDQSLSGLDQDCSFGQVEEPGSAGGLLYLKGLDDNGPIRVVGPGDELAQTTAVNSMTFGSRIGTDAGDRVAFAFGNGVFQSRGIEEGNGANSCLAPFPAEQDPGPPLGVCGRLADLLADAGLGRTPDLAYVVTFRADPPPPDGTIVLGDPDSVRLITCDGFVPVCDTLVPAEPVSTAIIRAGEPIDASDTDPYRGSRYW